jgi:hypothetical protein
LHVTSCLTIRHGNAFSFTVGEMVFPGCKGVLALAGQL